MQITTPSTDYLNNQLSKLARDLKDGRHNFGQYLPEDARSHLVDTWRYPVIESFRAEDNPRSYYFNTVTFVFPIDPQKPLQELSLMATFHHLYEPIPMQRLEHTPFFVLSCVVPKGEVHYYKFLADGETVLDRLNPQRQVLNNGEEWSRFFTHNCSIPVSFERWELVLLERLTDHILPFRTRDASIFLNNYYHHLEKTSRETIFSRAYLLDQSIGVVNFIDKLVAKEEHHRLRDYKVCLEIIDKVLRMRNPVTEPADMPRQAFVELYNEMAGGNVPGWDYARYSNPRFFLQLLRRHTLTGAFTHPKYGGNAECAGWAYLSERYRDPNGQTLFNWRLALEKPIGLSDEYYG